MTAEKIALRLRSRPSVTCGGTRRAAGHEHGRAGGRPGGPVPRTASAATAADSALLSSRLQRGRTSAQAWPTGKPDHRRANVCSTEILFTSGSYMCSNYPHATSLTVPGHGQMLPYRRQIGYQCPAGAAHVRIPPRGSPLADARAAGYGLPIDQMPRRHVSRQSFKSWLRLAQTAR